MGTRSGGSVAGAWALMKYLAKEGYHEIVRQVMEATKKTVSAINALPGLQVISDPDMSILAFTSENNDIFSIADLMEEKGWHMDRQQFPDSLHLTISWGNIKVIDEFILDLREVMNQTEKLTSESKKTRLTIRAATTASKVLPGKTIGKLASLFSGDKKKSGGSQKPRQAALYGLTGSLKSREKVSDAIAQLLDGMYRL
jgi:glutamate/tyrosine decarboxylase-like PLP-dependent enzyme